jgi:hypothetical protein
MFIEMPNEVENMSKKNGKKIRKNKKNGKWTKCPECGVKVRPKNLNQHIIRVHSAFYHTPKGKASIVVSVFLIAVVIFILLSNYNPWFGTQGGDKNSKSQNPSDGNENIIDPYPEETNLFERTVIIETFTSVDCYWCNAEEEPALKRIATDYDRDEVIILAYHGFYGNDPYETEEGNARAEYYGGVSGTPNVWFDGTENLVGGTGQGVDAMYNVYVDIINKRAPIATPISMGISGSITDSQAQISVDITQENVIDVSNLYVRFALMEDGLQYNGNTFHWVMRDFSERSIASGTFPLKLQESFDIDSSWNSENLRIVVCVQDDSDREVQQAAYFDFNA